MSRITLSLVLGLGTVAGIFSQTASAALPAATACKAGTGSNSSAYRTDYYRSNTMSAAAWDDNYYGRTNRFDCGTTGRDSVWDTRYPSSRYTNDWTRYDRYGSWNDSDSNWRQSSNTRLNRLRDAYLDRFDDYRRDRLPAHRFYDSYPNSRY